MSVFSNQSFERSGLFLTLRIANQQLSLYIALYFLISWHSITFLSNPLYVLSKHNPLSHFRPNEYNNGLFLNFYFHSILQFVRVSFLQFARYIRSPSTFSNNIKFCSACYQNATENEIPWRFRQTSVAF